MSVDSMWSVNNNNAIMSNYENNNDIVMMIPGEYLFRKPLAFNTFIDFSSVKIKLCWCFQKAFPRGNFHLAVKAERAVAGRPKTWDCAPA